MVNCVLGEDLNIVKKGKNIQTINKYCYKELSPKRLRLHS
jgi:hypothetical protein